MGKYQDEEKHRYDPHHGSCISWEGDEQPSGESGGHVPCEVGVYKGGNYDVL